MNIEVIENPEDSLIEFLDKKIDDFNWAHWEVKERNPIAVKITDKDNNIIAGAAGRTFGHWFLLDTLWVSDLLRGQNIGSKLLSKLETLAKEKGCKECLLDTLNFQAMPFYEKKGYEVQWVQKNYPKTGCKYFMTKEL
jgi:ribosomal protein S18 acetylase RimI-like enzyme